MAVDLPDETEMPAKRRRLLPREVRLAGREREEEEEEARYAAVRATDVMEGQESTAEPQPNHVIFTLGHDELKSGSKSNLSKARMAAKIKTSNALKRARSRSKTASENAASSMQM